MNFAEMPIERPRSEDTAIHRLIETLRNRRISWIKLAHWNNVITSNLR
jgi:hypothetical protein